MEYLLGLFPFIVLIFMGAGVAIVLRKQLEPLPTLLWIAWCVCAPIVGGLTAILYFRRYPAKNS